MNNFHTCLYILYIYIFIWYITRYLLIFIIYTYIYIYIMCFDKKLLMYWWTYQHQSSCIAATPMRDRTISFAQASRTSLQAAAHGDSVHVATRRLNLHLQPHPAMIKFNGIVIGYGHSTCHEWECLYWVLYLTYTLYLCTLYIYIYIYTL